MQTQRGRPTERVDGAGERVLVVEDNADVGTFATSALRELGYDTVFAADGLSALAALATDLARFDAVFSDVVMPGMIATVRRADDQKRWLTWTGVGGAAIGMTLWAALAGPIARAVPASWHWPERMAARKLQLPMWAAGQRLLATAAPGQFEAMVAGDRIVRANKTVLEGCRKAAAKVASRCDARSGWR